MHINSSNDITLRRIVNFGYMKDQSNRASNVLGPRKGIGQSSSLSRSTIVKKHRNRGGKSIAYLGLNDLSKLREMKNEADLSVASGRSNLSDVVERVQHSLFNPQTITKNNSMNTFAQAQSKYVMSGEDHSLGNT